MGCGKEEEKELLFFFFFLKHFKGSKGRIGNGLDKEDERDGRLKENLKVSSL